MSGLDEQQKETRTRSGCSFLVCFSCSFLVAIGLLLAVHCPQQSTGIAATVVVAKAIIVQGRGSTSTIVVKAGLAR